MKNKIKTYLIGLAIWVGIVVTNAVLWSFFHLTTTEAVLVVGIPGGILGTMAAIAYVETHES